MRFVALLFLAFLSFAAPACADDVANAQAAIRAQEQAFVRGDAAAAYSYASPAIKKLFPQADIFMYMVQNSYAPVWRHKSFEFGEARIEGKWVAQRVHIVDAGRRSLGSDVHAGAGRRRQLQDHRLLAAEGRAIRLTSKSPATIVRACERIDRPRFAVAMTVLSD